MCLACRSRTRSDSGRGEHSAHHVRDRDRDMDMCVICGSVVPESHHKALMCNDCDLAKDGWDMEWLRRGVLK